MVGDLEVSPIYPPIGTVCPASPSLQWVPWALVPHLPRSYARLRLPPARLGSLHLLGSLPDPWSAPALCVPLPVRGPPGAACPRQGSGSAGTPALPAGSDKETGGSPTFPRSPCESMPRSQTPVGSGTHRLYPSRTVAFRSAPRRRLSLGLPPRLSSCPRLYTFRGSITRPGFLLPPAPYSPRGACTRRSLLTCWLGFG
jgi:hypothetical protein